MSINAPEWFVTQYKKRVTHIYQNMGNRLRPMVTAAGRIEGEKAIFWLAGKAKAYKKKRNQKNIPSNSPRKKFEALLETFKSFETVEEFDLDRMNVDEREVVYKAGAMALGRATDIELYAKMHAAKTTVDGSLNFSAGAFSAGQAMLLCDALQGDKVPWDGQVYCGLPKRPWNQLLANKVVNSADHVKDLPFAKATDTRFWNGVNWFLQEEEDPQDLYPNPSSNVVDCMIWHKSAMGWANNQDLRVITQWHNEYDWWSFNMDLKGAATTLQEGNGIHRFRVSTDSAIAIV